MKHNLISFLFIGLLLFSASGKGYSQISLIEDGFLNRQLFFTPATVSPNNLGMFENVAPGLFDHPLQEAYLNPARLGRNLETSHYFYTDYRTPSSIERSVYRFPSQEDTGEYSFGAIGIPTPISIIHSTGDEPHFTGAWIYRPQSRRNFVIGVTYRQLLASDPYYDNYRRIQLGTGIRHITQTDAPGVPLEREQYDRFRQTGHIPSIMASMRLSDVLTAGLRTSVTHYTGSGNLQDGRFIVEEVQGPGLDRISTMKQDDDEPILVEREEHAYINRGVEQQYFHWETTAGIQLDLSDIRSVGLTAGILYGEVDQLFGVDHFISIQQGRQYQDDEWIDRYDNLSVSQRWDRYGYHYFGTVEYLRRAGDENQHRMQIFYRWGYISLNIGNRGTGTSQTKYNYVRYNPTAGQTHGKHETTSIAGNDLDGSITGWHHRFGINRQILFGNRTSLMIGVSLGRVSESKHRENYAAERFNLDIESGSDGELYTNFSRTHSIFNRTTDDRVRLTSLFLPLVLRIQISERFLIEGGGLLRYNDITTTQLMEHTRHYSRNENPDGIREFPPTTFEGEREENEDEALVAGLLSVGYRVMPGTTIRLTGVTETRITDNDFGMPMPASLTLSARPETIGGTGFMISLEVGI